MESKMFLVILSIVIFSCLIQSSFALKCYSCESTSNSKCSDLSDKSIQPQDCVAENFISQGSSILSNLGFGGNSNSGSKSDAVVPVCLKMVAHNTTNHSVVRRCMVKTQSQDPCTLARTGLERLGVNNQLDFCGVCEEEACNDANSMKLFSALIVFGTILSTLRLFA